MEKKTESASVETPIGVAMSTNQPTTILTRSFIAKLSVCGYYNVLNPGNLIDSGYNGYYATFQPTAAWIIIEIPHATSPGVTMDLYVGGTGTISIYTSDSCDGTFVGRYSGSVNNSGMTTINFSVPICTKYILIQTTGTVRVD